MMANRLRYFQGICGLRDAHRRYRELAKRLHPDRPGGRNDWFQEMATEYASVVEALRAKRNPESAVPVATAPRGNRTAPPSPGTRPSPGARPSPGTIPLSSTTPLPASLPATANRAAKPSERSAELATALDSLADAAGNVISALLKRVIR
jgi:hypothetical protein